MRILGHLERFGPPAGGGVITTVTILRELASRGHEVSIVTNRTGAPDFPEIATYEAVDPGTFRILYHNSDLIVPHMTATPIAMDFAREANVPVLYPVHDDGQIEHYNLTPADVAMVIFNSNGLRERTAWIGRQAVVHPPTYLQEHRVEQTGDAVTIASLSPEKGAGTFWKLVERMPDRRFIGVVGGWGEQVIPDSLPANVEIMEHQGTNLQEVFRETRILLVPSQRLSEGQSYWTENWGRASLEAAASGIPSIANPAPGPVEALGEAGIFHARDDIDAWVEAITRLDNPEVYRAQSELVYNRALEVERIVEQQLNDVDATLKTLIRDLRQEQMTI